MTPQKASDEQLVAAFKNGKTNLEVATQFQLSVSRVEKRKILLRQKGLLEVVVKRNLKDLTKDFCKQFGGRSPNEVIQSGRATVEQWCDWIKQEAREVRS